MSWFRKGDEYRKAQYEKLKGKGLTSAVYGATMGVNEEKRMSDAKNKEPWNQEWDAYVASRKKLIEKAVTNAINQHSEGNKDEITKQVLDSVFPNVRDKLNNQHPVVCNNLKINNLVDGEPRLDRQLKSEIEREIDRQLQQLNSKGGNGNRGGEDR